MTITRPRLLIEDWLPIKELGIESRREAAPIPGQFPKLKTLHVWWARRPLAASAGTILCSLLPAWTQDLADTFDDPRVTTEKAYREWALWLMGVWGDPVEAKRIADRNRDLGIRSTANPYGYKQAFRNSPAPADLSLIHRVLEWTWSELPSVADPTAGGGSIPYTAARYGLPTYANDLNAVAATVLRAGLEATSVHGVRLVEDLRRWGEELTDRCVNRLSEYFPSVDAEQATNYLFARTVICPRTQKPSPLSPNWWISRKRGSEVAVRVITERNGDLLDECEFEILEGGVAKSSDPDTGTVSGGHGMSVWDGLPIDGDYIKTEAQTGRMGSQLYAVAFRFPNPGRGRSQWSRGFRTATPTDIHALVAADKAIHNLRAEWIASGVMPDNGIPDGNKTDEPLRYGMTRWVDLFSPRQQLVHGVFVDEWQRIRPEIEAQLGAEHGRTVAASWGGRDSERAGVRRGDELGG